MALVHEGTDFLYYVLGVNIIPADTVNKKPLVAEWKRLQSEELTEQEYLANKQNDAYNQGVAIICGKIWRGLNKDKWINGIDLDNEIAIREFCSQEGKYTVEEFLRENLYEFHKDDSNSLHIYIITDKPIKSKARGTIDIENQPAIEIKSNGDKIMFSYPSLHGNYKGQQPIFEQWQFNELKQPAWATTERLEARIDTICSKYRISYLDNNKDRIKQRLRERDQIPEGSRHNELLKQFNTLWWKYIEKYSDGKVTEGKVFEEALKIADLCQPPHDQADIERIFADSFAHVSNLVEQDPKTASKEIDKASKNSAKQEQEQKEQQEAKRIEDLAATIPSFENWQIGLKSKYDALHHTILKLMPDVWPSLEFEMSVRNILYIEDIDRPFAGILLGRPSSSKTLGISMFKGQRHTFYTDDFTAKSFLSHASGISKDELEAIDMLPKIENKFFLTPELAPLFNDNEDNLRKTMGVLTRILDGQGYSSDTGAHGHRSYDREMIFSWIGATAIVSPKVYDIMSQLGPRLYFLRLPKVEKKDDEYVEIFRANRHKQDILIVKRLLADYYDWLEACPTAVKDEVFKSKIRKIPWDSEGNSEETLRIIIKLGRLLAPLRGSIPTWLDKNESRRSYYNHGLAVVEDPIRAISQLINLAKGHALITGRNHITNDDVKILVNVVLSTAPEERASVFDLLLNNKGILSAKDIEKLLGVSIAIAHKTIHQLTGLGLVDHEKMEYSSYEDNEEKFDNTGKRYKKWVIILKSQFNWFLGEEFKKLRN